MLHGFFFSGVLFEACALIRTNTVILKYIIQTLKIPSYIPLVNDERISIFKNFQRKHFTFNFYQKIMII